jgi:ABC-2 type transport system permease protein
MTLFAPLVLTALIYFAFGGIVDGDVSMLSMSVGVVNADTLPENAPLPVSLGENIREVFFDDSVTSWIAAVDYPDADAAREAVDRQEIDVAVMIPQGFTAAVLAGETGESLTILQDPTLTIAPNVVRDMVTAVLDGITGGSVAYLVVNERLEASGASLAPEAIPSILERYNSWYVDFQRNLFHHPEAAALVMTSPAVAGRTKDTLQTLMGLVMAGQMIFFSTFTASYAMNSVLLEDEEGTLSRLFTTPTQRTLILSGKFLAVFLTVAIQGLALICFGWLAFKVQWGEAGVIVLALSGQMFASVGLGVLLISFIKTSKQAGFVMGGVLTGLGMISGLFTTNIEMPTGFNALGNFTPQGWVLKAWRLSLAGQPAKEVLLPFVVLVGMGMVMFAVGAVFFRRRYA